MRRSSRLASARGSTALTLPYIPGVASAFGFTPPGASLVTALLVIVLAYVASTEAAKRAFFRHRHAHHTHAGHVRRKSPPAP